MKRDFNKALIITLLSIGLGTHAQADPWWRPGKTPVKTVQLALPSTNGGIVSVTVPAKTAPARRIAGHWPNLALDQRRAQAAKSNQKDDERIAADLERHF